MSDRAPRVAVRTLGCKVNRAESEALAESLLGFGVEIVAPDDADVIVVNTCTVTGEADAKARKAVRRALAAESEPLVVVTGCMAALDGDALRALGDRVIVESDKSRLTDHVLAALSRGGEVRRSDSPRRGPSPASTASLSPTGSPDCGTRGGPLRPAAAATFRTRVMVKVQDGCDHRCAYCIVPDARGLPTSVPAGEVVARVGELTRAGKAEVVLTGVNIGRYADGGADLGALVERIAATGIARIRISSIEPLDLTDELLDTLASIHAVMPHLHVPLQSGCDTTLEAMGRGYDTAAFADAVGRARAALPGLAVTTDVIAGFPGESDEDFAESLAFVEACGFARLHVFRYSKRAGTPAAEMPEQVAPAARARRAHALRELGDTLTAAHAAVRVGGTADVLVESRAGTDAIGTSEDYLRVTVRGSDTQVGNVERVRISGVVGGAVEAASDARMGSDSDRDGGDKTTSANH